MMVTSPDCVASIFSSNKKRSAPEDDLRQEQTRSKASKVHPDLQYMESVHAKTMEILFKGAQSENSNLGDFSHQVSTAQFRSCFRCHSDHDNVNLVQHFPGMSLNSKPKTVVSSSVGRSSCTLSNDKVKCNPCNACQKWFCRSCLTSCDQCDQVICIICSLTE
jgi:hypothetical protein